MFKSHGRQSLSKSYWLWGVRVGIKQTFWKAFWTKKQICDFEGDIFEKVLEQIGSSNAPKLNRLSVTSYLEMF